MVFVFEFSSSFRFSFLFIFLYNGGGPRSRFPRRPRQRSSCCSGAEKQSAGSVSVQRGVVVGKVGHNARTAGSHRLGTTRLKGRGRGREEEGGHGGERRMSIGNDAKKTKQKNIHALHDVPSILGQDSTILRTINHLLFKSMHSNVPAPFHTLHITQIF